MPLKSPNLEFCRTVQETTCAPMRDIAIDQFRSNSVLCPMHGGQALDKTGHPALAVLGGRTSNSRPLQWDGKYYQHFTKFGIVNRTRAAGFRGKCSNHYATGPSLIEYVHCVHIIKGSCLKLCKKYFFTEIKRVPNYVTIPKCFITSDLTVFFTQYVNVNALI